MRGLVLFSLVVLTFGGCAKTDGGKQGADLRAASVDLLNPDLAPPPDLSIVDLAPLLLGNGEACAQPAQCGSGYCTDGVCCDSACTGVCESCAVVGALGHCSAVPSGLDPDSECRGTPTLSVDGGLGDGGDFSNVDGGSFVNYTPCVGACNGKRACGFPDGKTACGAPYCSEANQRASFVCDGKGGCEVAKQDCPGTFCQAGQCPSQCDEPADCTVGNYCNGATSQCAPIKANGLLCDLAYECQTGFCERGVCCNQACAPPGSCDDAGHEGVCRCGGKVCGPGIACKLFYRDLDQDTFGDRYGTLENFNARAGCTGDTPPSGFVDNDLDCDDADARANPNATDFYDQPSLGRGIFDYNCDGQLSKETREHASGACVFCSGPTDACASSSTCSSNGQGAVMTCEAGLTFCGCGNFLCFCSRCGAGIFSSPGAGFVGTVACGDTGDYRVCGSCATAGGTVSGTTDDYAKVQRCR